MAKTDNLTDFLTGLANKFRAKLGGTALINPQSFESKIDEVYQKGYDSAPQGVDTSDATAAAGDILAGKTAYVQGSKVTGTIYSSNNGFGGVADGGSIYLKEDGSLLVEAKNTEAAYYPANVNMSILAGGSDVASVIGLTADKIVAGNTILGVAGTAQTGGTTPNGIYVFDSHFGAIGAVTLEKDIQTPRLFIATAINLPDTIGNEYDPGYVIGRFGGSWSSLEFGNFVYSPNGTESTVSFTLDNYSNLIVVDEDFGVELTLGKFAIIYDV